MGEEIRIEKDRRQTNELKENIQVDNLKKKYKKKVHKRKEIMKKKMNTGSSRKLKN